MKSSHIPQSKKSEALSDSLPSAVFYHKTLSESLSAQLSAN